MCAVEIRLLGRPSVTVGGKAVPPSRGAKAWGVLAYLAASERGRSRPEIAELLFAAAEDPLGALRWNLAALRRLLGLPDVLKGDYLRLDLPEGATVDTRLLDADDPAALDEPGLGHELLAGLGFPDSPTFETWLVAERRRLARKSTALLREAALSASAKGEHERAIRFATGLVTNDPLDEGYHALLIRIHAAADDTQAARHQFEACRRILGAELGTEPGPAVVAALHAADARAPRVAAPSPRELASRLAVAWQAFLSGAIDHGLDLGRGANSLADAGDDERMRVATRTTVGAMLGMAVRGWDEAATLLSEAFHIAQRIERPADAAEALGIRAGVEMMRADYAVARRCAQTGLSMSDHPSARSVNLMFLAATTADLGDLNSALGHADPASSAARESGDPVRILYAATHAARIHLMAGDVSEARSHVDRALASGDGTMLALKPWVMSVVAEIELAEGNARSARRHAEEAATLAAITSIAYQRALASRAIGLAEWADGNSAAAVAHLTEALSHARRTTGEGYTFHWPVAFVLDSLADVTSHQDPAESRRWASALLDHAERVGMGHFVNRARQRIAESRSSLTTVIRDKRPATSLDEQPAQRARA